MGQQSDVDNLLTRIADADSHLDSAISETENIHIRNKRGIEVHSMLRDIKAESDKMPDADPDKQRVEAALKPVARRLLEEIFQLPQSEVENMQ